MKNRNHENFYRRHLVAEAGFNVSWSSIFAGVITFFASLAVLSLIGSAIGFGIVEPTASDPLSGVGTGVIIWTVVTMLVSFMAGGFVAGVSARRVGILHGFLTWASSVILLLVMVTFLTTSIFSSVGTIMGNAFSAVGDGTSSLTSNIDNIIEVGMNNATDGLDAINTDKVQAQIRDILKDTQTPELQPGYLNNQLEESKTEIRQAGRTLLLNPDNADEILTSLTTSLEEKAEKIGQALDRETIASAVSANTELTEAEAREATDNIYNGLELASKEAQELIDQASQRIEVARQQVEQTIEEARIQAEKATKATAVASIWAFIGLILAMVVSSLSGIWGSKFVEVRDEETM